jgi:hypothetical protein
MIKYIILVGIPKVFLAFRELAKVEGEEDCDYTFTRFVNICCFFLPLGIRSRLKGLFDFKVFFFDRAGWKPGDANRERGLEVLETLYQGAQHANHAACGAHEDCSKYFQLPSILFTIS